MSKKLTIRTKETPAKSNYRAFINQLKEKIRTSRIKAAVSANKELILLYWELGKDIVQKQEKEGWGSKVLERVAQDLQNEFPGVEGFSKRNVFRMRAFYREYQIVPLAVAQIDKIGHLGILTQIPWSHNVILMEKLDNVKDRVWYAHKTIENGWSRDVLAMWIDSDLHKREGKAVTNFKQTLPAPQSDLANNTLKDPYLIGFFTLSDKAKEKDIENQLMEHLQKFLVELGQGFAFVGRQYPIKAGKKDLFIDLLFYHLTLRCYVVVELKAREFDSRDAGQMSAYLSAVDDLLKRGDDQPSIGIILCKTKDNVFVEYVLRNFNRPIGVAEFEVKLVEKLPNKLKSSLPSVEEIESELSTLDIIKKSNKKKKKNRKARKK
jgi:predicted nuclease of restriction endonuclease-like (RecB) superfamily